MEQEFETRVLQENGEPDLKPEPVRWYQNITLKDAKTFIQANIASAARSFIAIGYYLKVVRDGELYTQDGYSTIWDFACQEYGLSKSTASRYMTMNDRFSKDKDSPIVAEEYREFGKSQLQEMLYLTDEQVDLVTPETQVKQIRAIRGPEREVPYIDIPGQLSIADFPEIIPVPQAEAVISRSGADTLTVEDFGEFKEFNDKETESGSVATSQQEPEKCLSAYGDPKREYPEGSYISTTGCGQHDCFACHMSGCNIRQEDCYCVEAPMVNPFPCATLKTIDAIQADVIAQCQFVNLDLAYHRAGDGEPVPCCKDCKDKCDYACSRAVDETKECNPKYYTIQYFLEEQKEKLVAVTEAEAPEKMIQRQRFIVAALEEMECQQEQPEPAKPEQPEQPELPALKNNDKRGAFVDAYEIWPLWVETKETEERYYRYDLPDGTSMVVKVYLARLFDYKAAYDVPYEQRFNDGWGKAEYYLLKDGKHFKDCEVNKSLLVEHLKDLQKKKAGEG